MFVAARRLDLSAAWDRSQVPEAKSVSAVTGEGIPQLCEALSTWLVPQPPPPGAAVPFTPELCDRVQEARQQHAKGNREEARRILAGLLAR
jgi:tRNA modification GTPase